jgi:hypothetical protein
MRRIGVVLALLAAAVVAVAAAAARARGVPLSPLRAGRRVGADWGERRGVVTGDRPAGEMDDLAAYEHAGFDPGAVHPVVRWFYERTADHDLVADVTWHRGFRVGAHLASRLTSCIGQLNLPGPRGDGLLRLDSRFAGVDAGADPRDGARLWTRTRADSDDAVFVAAYASHVHDGERFVNIAAPLPGANMSTVLRVRNVGGADGGTGVKLTTTGDGHPGLYLGTRLGALALPLDQRFRVWPADAVDAPDAPGDPTGGDAVAVATHEMRVVGRQFLAIRYGIVPSPQN